METSKAIGYISIGTWTADRILQNGMETKSLFGFLYEIQKDGRPDTSERDGNFRINIGTDSGLRDGRPDTSERDGNANIQDMFFT